MITFFPYLKVDKKFFFRYISAVKQNIVHVVFEYSIYIRDPRLTMAD